MGVPDDTGRRLTPYVAFSMLGACGFWCARGARGAPCPLIESVLMRSLSRSRNDCGGMYVSYM